MDVHDKVLLIRMVRLELQVGLIEAKRLVNGFNERRQIEAIKTASMEEKLNFLIEQALQMNQTKISEYEIAAVSAVMDMMQESTSD